MEEIKSCEIGWFDITKDIIIPSLTLISTVVLGTIIAMLLRRKEERTKTKSLLIDNYMEYLNKRTEEVENQAYFLTVKLLRNILANYEYFFDLHANIHLTNKVISDRIQEHEKYRSKDKNGGHWSPYTYKFCFLLGTKIYFKEAQALENNITNIYLKNNVREKYYESIVKKIQSNIAIKEKMKSSNMRLVADALDDIEKLVFLDFVDYQRQIFEPYNNKIADLIDSY